MSYILLITIHADPAMPPGYDEWGGTHTYMRELLDCFGSLHLNCILVTRKAMQELPDIEQYNSCCTIYRLKNGDPAPIDKTILYTYHDYNLSAIQQIIEDRGELPQVIHSVYWNSGRLGVELSKKYNIPLVHSVISNSYGRQARGAYEPLPQRASYEQLIYDYAQWILCVSKDEKNDLIKYYGISPKKIIVAGQYIHPSFILPSRDINGFPRLNSKISTEAQLSASLQYNNAFENNVNDSFWVYKAFTYFGRIDESKGVDHILNAWCSLYRKYEELCPPLWLIGGSIKEINIIRNKCQAIENYIHQAEQDGKIIWWGCIDAIGASTLLLKTLVLITNSLYEPGGRVITEAMSEGIPVIASPNGFALDLVHDWDNGFLVNHGDENALSMRMEHFIRQPFLSTIEDIDSLLDVLSMQFPDYYFESNGSFLPFVGWKMAQYILDYNSLPFDFEQKAFLYGVCNSFSHVVKLPLNINWYEITSDISLQHIMLDNGNLNLIDREKRTIGQVEYMIADLLLDIIIGEKKVSSNTWITLLEQHIPQNCNKKQIIESVSYKLFFNTILESVMQNEVNPYYLNVLNVLLHMESRL